MNIGVDLDDVLADFRNGWLNFYNTKYKTSHTPKDIFSYDLSKVLGITRRQVVKRIEEYYLSDDFSEIQPMYGARKTVRELMRYNKLYLITSRPSWIEDRTTEWIENNFKEVFEEIVSTNLFAGKKEDHVFTKGEVCLNFDISLVIEDAPIYVKEIAEKDVNVLLFDQPWNQGIEECKRVKRVKTWKEIGEIL